MAKQFASSTEEMLGEIRRLAQGGIETVTLNPILDEVRVHLDEAIQARLELGLSPEEATSEAIASFGDPEEFVQHLSLQRPHLKKAWFDREFFWPLSV